MGSGSASNTRCAALTCSTFLSLTPVKAEQNCKHSSNVKNPDPKICINSKVPGQGLVHGLLRQELVTYAQNKAGYIPNRSVVLFTFMPANYGADGIAARVVVMRDNGDGTDSQQTQRQTMQARELNSTTHRTEWTAEEIKAAIKAGRGYEHVVHANESYVGFPVLHNSGFWLLGRCNAVVMSWLTHLPFIFSSSTQEISY